MVSSREDFIKNACSLHKNKYDYSKFIYTKSICKSIITCGEHGDFMQSANKHLMLRGCPKCGLKSRTIKKIKSKESKIQLILQEKGLTISHKNSEKLLKNKDKVLFECIRHGEFTSTIDSITSKGSNCPKCTVESKPYINNKMGYSFFKRKAEEKCLKEVYFYIIFLEGNGEKFIKLVVTTNLKKRFTHKLPYNVKSIKFILLNTEDALHIEDLCRVKGEYKYEPKLKFGGYTECATSDLIGYLILTCKENGWTDFSEFKD